MKKSKNRRTIPSGSNSQLVRIYVSSEMGTYKYIEPEHKLEYISDVNLVLNIGSQKMMRLAPLGIIYVANFAVKTGIIKSDFGQKMFVAGTEAGMMSQNVYLYAAANNLNTVLLALTNRDYLSEQLGLDENSIVVYSQVIGKSTI